MLYTKETIQVLFVSIDIRSISHFYSFIYSPSHTVQITEFLEFLHKYCMKKNLKRSQDFKLIKS